MSGLAMTIGNMVIGAALLILILSVVVFVVDVVPRFITEVRWILSKWRFDLKCRRKERNR